MAKGFAQTCTHRASPVLRGMQLVALLMVVLEALPCYNVDKRVWADAQKQSPVLQGVGLLGLQFECLEVIAALYACGAQAPQPNRLAWQPFKKARDVKVALPVILCCLTSQGSLRLPDFSVPWKCLGMLIEISLHVLLEELLECCSNHVLL